MIGGKDRVIERGGGREPAFGMEGIRVGEVEGRMVCAVLGEGDSGLYIFVSYVAYEIS